MNHQGGQPQPLVASLSVPLKTPTCQQELPSLQPPTHTHNPRRDPSPLLGLCRAFGVRLHCPCPLTESLDVRDYPTPV